MQQIVVVFWEMVVCRFAVSLEALFLFSFGSVVFLFMQLISVAERRCFWSGAVMAMLAKG